MTDPLLAPDLDRDAVVRWQERLAAHLLGGGLLVAVLAALPTAPTDLDRHQLPKETVVHLATWLAVALLRPGVAALSRAARVGLALLLGATLASAALAENPWLALRAGSLTLTGAAALLTAHRLAARGFGPILLHWLGVTAFVGTLTGLAQAYGLQLPNFATTRLPGGSFGNRNFLAHLAAIALPIIGLLALTTRRWLGALVAAIAAGALVGAIVLTRSRAAWLAAAAAIGVVVLSLLLARRKGALPVSMGRVALLGFAVVVGPFLVLTLPNDLNWRSDSPYAETLTGIANAQEGSGRGRVIQYRNSLRLAAAHPVLGVGPGNWPIRYGDVAPPNDPTWVWGDAIPINPWPSSDWMALISERGVFALAGSLLLGLALAWRAFGRLQRAGDDALRGAAALGVLAATAVVGAFDAVLLLPVPLLFVALAIGALTAPAETPEELAAPSRWRVALPLLLMLVSARSVEQTAAYLVAGSGRETNRMVWAARLDPTSYPLRIALASRLPCARARSHARAALALAPEWPASRNAAARCGVR
ncbi:MAG: O-antigen ligase family protein [Gemmatimonadales bacterium]